LIVTVFVVVITLVASALVYGALKFTVGIRLSAHDEKRGSDLALHLIEANPEEAF
jgi:Amt family ammonium transporter